MTKFDALDDLDKQILALLQDDGTLANATIGDHLGVSEATVRRRRNRLHELDIARTVAVTDPFKLGFNVIVIIGIRAQQNRIEQVEHALVQMPEVRFLGITLGTYDLMLEAWFRSNEDLMQFVTVTLAGIEGIERTESFQIMRLSKYTYDWGTPSAAQQALCNESTLHQQSDGG